MVSGAADPLRGCIDSRTCNKQLATMRNFVSNGTLHLGDALSVATLRRNLPAYPKAIRGKYGCNCCLPSKSV